jgi:hypothetical protein
MEESWHNIHFTRNQMKSNKIEMPLIPNLTKQELKGLY